MGSSGKKNRKGKGRDQTGPGARHSQAKPREAKAPDAKVPETGEHKERPEKKNASAKSAAAKSGTSNSGDSKSQVSKTGDSKSEDSKSGSSKSKDSVTVKTGSVSSHTKKNTSGGISPEASHDIKETDLPPAENAEGVKSEGKKSKKSIARDHDREITMFLSIVLLLLTIAGLILFFIMPDPESVKPVPIEVSDIQPSALPESGTDKPLPSDDPADQDKPGDITEPDKPEGPDDTVIAYPAPDYDFKEEDVYVEVEGLDHPYTIAWVSDVHLITDSKPGDVYYESLPTVLDRYENLSVTPDGVHAEELWPEIIDYLNYNDFDAVIFGGDILDYCSTSNMFVLQWEMGRLKYPSDRILYLRADHDYGTWYSDGSTGLNDALAHEMHAAIDGDDNTHKYLDFGDLIIAGVNNSIKKPGEEQMKVLTELYGRGIPVIAATHVPYYSEVDPSLEELSMAVRNRLYYWSPDCTTYEPDTDMWKYLNLIYDEDSPCEYVLAGHLHAEWDGEIREGLREHIFSPAFSGTIGIVHVVPEGEMP